MPLEELDRLFQNPANRRLGIFYHCAADPRIIAPSRPNWKGWQINFAHPKAVRFLLFYLSVLLGPVAIVVLLGPENLLRTGSLAFGAFFLSTVFLIWLSRHLSRKHAA